MGSSLVGRARVAVLVLTLATLGVAAGCYWSKYDKLVRTHVQLLLAMADKLDAVTAEEGVPPASLAEYRYPLERARDFIRIVAPRFEGRSSLAALRRTCDAYGVFVEAAERWRPDAEADGPAAMARAHAALTAAATETISALDAERRS